MEITSNQCNWIIGICTLFVVLLPLFGDVYNRNHRWFFRFTYRYYLIIAFTIIGIWATSKKDSIANAEQNQQAVDAEKKRIESNNEIAKTFGEALGKWGFRLDSQSNEIKNKIATIPISKQVPHVFIESTRDIGMVGDSIYWKVMYTNDGSGIAENIRITYDAIIVSNNTYVYRKIGKDITNSLTTLGLTGHGTASMYILARNKSVDLNRNYYLFSIHYENKLSNFTKDEYMIYVLQATKDPVFGAVNSNNIPELKEFINRENIPHFRK